MDRGQVVEVGPHDELMARQGAYWRLYQAQVRRADGADEEHDAVLEADDARLAARTATHGTAQSAETFSSP